MKIFIDAPSGRRGIKIELVRISRGYSRSVRIQTNFGVHEEVRSAGCRQTGGCDKFYGLRFKIYGKMSFLRGKREIENNASGVKRDTLEKVRRLPRKEVSLFNVFRWCKVSIPAEQVASVVASLCSFLYIWRQKNSRKAIYRFRERLRRD
jgi:hypothetical protein